LVNEILLSVILQSRRQDQHWAFQKESRKAWGSAVYQEDYLTSSYCILKYHKLLKFHSL
jgi:hypothetical protein